jgi:succinate dehydrogenase cytochrome b556 subunit
MIGGAKFAIAWPFCYHFANGLRHLAWDAGHGFDLKVLYQSGWGVVGVATIASAGIMSM